MPSFLHIYVCVQVLGSTNAYVKKVERIMFLAPECHLIWLITPRDFTQWLSCIVGNVVLSFKKHYPSLVLDSCNIGGLVSKR